MNDWITDGLPDLVGTKEAAELLGVNKMTLKRWLEPGSGENGPAETYMIPPKRIAAGPVWAKDDVVRFADEHGRRRPGPAKSAAA